MDDGILKSQTTLETRLLQVEASINIMKENDKRKLTIKKIIIERGAKKILMNH